MTVAVDSDEAVLVVVAADGKGGNIGHKQEVIATDVRIDSLVRV